MTLNDTVTINEAVFVQKIDDEMVILDAVNVQYFGLDEMAALIWHYLGETKGSLQGVFDTIYTAYEVDAQQLETDICYFVQELVDAGLVHKDG